MTVGFRVMIYSIAALHYSCVVTTFVNCASLKRQIKDNLERDCGKRLSGT